MSNGHPVTDAPLLPAEFHDLEPYIEWALATERERYAKRMASSMDQMRAFYDAMMPRAKEAKVFLDRIPLPEMDLPAQRLMWMLFSLINVSYPVDVYGQPMVPDGGAAVINRIGEPPSFPV